MPGFDGTGPRGQGSMTGGGRGFCAVPFSGATLGYLGRRFFGRGFFGRGGGRGRGFRAGFRPFGGWVDPGEYQVSPKEEIADFKEQAEILQEQLRDIQERISALQKADEETAKK